MRGWAGVGGLTCADLRSCADALSRDELWRGHQVIGVISSH
jgi:hypothetical protein